MKLKLLLCLFAASTTVHAANYIGDQTLALPFSVTEPVNIVGNVVLATPGNYSASSWNVVGNVRISTPGDYTFTATSGSITIAGQLIGPGNGSATLHVRYSRVFTLVGVVASSVSLRDESHPPVEPGTAPAANAPLMNLSTRVTLAAGGSASAGFVIGGTAARRVLVRAIGPGLAPFDVRGVLANPTLTLFNGSETVGTNDDWTDDETTLNAFGAAGAFVLTPGSKDAALVLTLSPGAYTATVRGASATESGEALVEVYLVE